MEEQREGSGGFRGRLVGQEVDWSIRLHFISGCEVLQNNEGLVFFCRPR